MQVATLIPGSSGENTDVIHMTRECDKFIGIDKNGLECYSNKMKPQRFVLGNLDIKFIKVSRANPNLLFVCTDTELYELSRKNMKARKLYGPTPSPINLMRVSDSENVKIILVCEENIYVIQDKHELLNIPITDVVDTRILSNGCVCCITKDKFMIFGKDGEKRLVKHGPGDMKILNILGKVGFIIVDEFGAVYLFNPKTQSFSKLCELEMKVASVQITNLSIDTDGEELHCLFFAGDKVKGFVTRGINFESEILGIPDIPNATNVIPCSYVKDGGIIVVLETGCVMWYDTLQMTWGIDKQKPIVFAQCDTNLKMRYVKEEKKIQVVSDIPVSCMAFSLPVNLGIVSTEPVCNILANRRGLYVISCPPTSLSLKLSGDGTGTVKLIATNVPNKGGLERAYELSAEVE